MEKIKMDGERQRYTVQAADDRYIIATKPFNARRTYLYTIIDRASQIRGPIGLIFGLPCDVDSPEGANRLLNEMRANGWGVSYKNRKPLTQPEVSQVCSAPTTSSTCCISS